jgi:hypothetical protein
MALEPKPIVSNPDLQERFRSIDGVPAPGDGGVLEPLLVAVEDRATGKECALKLWRKTGSPVDKDLRQLWSHQFRQVERLMGYADAQDVMEASRNMVSARVLARVISA